MYTVRFGFTTEHNGDYTLISTATFPSSFEYTSVISQRWKTALAANGASNTEKKRVGGSVRMSPPVSQLAPEVRAVPVSTT